MQDLVDNNNKNRMKSAENPLTFSQFDFLLPAYLLWAILPSIILFTPPLNAFKKRLNKTCLFFVFKKQAEKATNTNIKLKITIELYVLIILF